MQIEPYRFSAGGSPALPVRRGRGQGKHTHNTTTNRVALQHAITEANKLLHQSSKERLAHCVFIHTTSIKTKQAIASKTESTVSSQSSKMERSTSSQSSKMEPTTSSGHQSQGVRKRGRPFSTKQQKLAKKQTTSSQFLQCLGIRGNDKPLTMATLLQSFQSQCNSIILPTVTQTVEIPSKPHPVVKSSDPTKLTKKPQQLKAATNPMKKVAAKQPSLIKNAQKSTNCLKQVTGTRLVQAALGKSPDSTVVMVMPQAMGVKRRAVVSRRSHHVKHKSVSSSAIVDYFKKQPQNGKLAN